MLAPFPTQVNAMRRCLQPHGLRQPALMSEGGQRRTLLDFILLSGGEGLSKVAGFVAFAYLARTLTSDDYGAVELAASFAVFFSLMVDFGLGTIGARETSQARERVHDFATWIPSARLLLSLIALPVMAVLPILMGQPERTTHLVWLFAVSMLFLTWNQRWLFQGLEQMRVVAGAQLLRMVVFAALVLVAVQSQDDLLTVGIIEATAVGLMAAYFLGHQLKRKIPIRLAWPKAELTKLYKDASSVGLGQMVWAFNQQTPIFIIATFMASELAWFGSANRIFVSLSTFSMLYHFNLFPTFSRLLRESKEAYFETVQSSFRFSIWGSSVIALGLTVVATDVCALVFGDDFAASGPALAVMIWSLPITLASGHPRWSLIAAGKQRYVLVSQICGAVSTAALGFVLIPRYGALGAGMTNVGASLVVWGVAQLYARRYIGKLPFIIASLKPAVGVGAGLATAQLIDNAWIAGPVGGIAMLAVAALSDRALVDDVKRLAGARKGPAATASASADD